MNRFATENIAFWQPEGTPSARIFFAFSGDIFNSETRTNTLPLLRTREMKISTAEIYCDVMLAIATPATSRLQTITKNRLRSTLITPAIPRKTSGRFVSPEALSTPLPKL